MMQDTASWGTPTSKHYSGTTATRGAKHVQRGDGNLTRQQTIEALAMKVTFEAGQQAHTHVCHCQVIPL